MTRTLHRFTAVIHQLASTLRGARVVHSLKNGELRLKVFRAPASFWSTTDTIVLEAPHGFGRWYPIGVFDPDDLTAAANLLHATTEWYREHHEHHG